MRTPASSYERVFVESRAEWREWLKMHHATSTGIWLVTYKPSSGKPRPTYDEVVEEALCFGWIDSRANALDDERTMQMMTPRRPGSPWSKLNKERITRLSAEGLIAPAGQTRIDAAKHDGSWSAYDEIEKLTVPPDLADALSANDAARRQFDAFSPSQRKQLLWWIESAKRPETRTQRIADLVAAAADGRNPLNWRANQNAKTDTTS